MAVELAPLCSGVDLRGKRLRGNEGFWKVLLSGDTEETILVAVQVSDWKFKSRPRDKNHRSRTGRERHCPSEAAMHTSRPASQLPTLCGWTSSQSSACLENPAPCAGATGTCKQMEFSGLPLKSFPSGGEVTSDGRKQGDGKS